MVGTLVVLFDAAVLAARHGPAVLLWALPLAAAAVLVARRWPLAAFVAALALAHLTGAGYALMVWSAFHAGRAARSRADLARTAGAATAGAALQVLSAPLAAAPRSLAIATVFVALPLLVGRYQAQHARLVAALRQRNAETAERERLAERLRLARDMHDSLGHHLSLVSVQAAALQVATPLPEPHRTAVDRLAAAARAAADELHGVVGTLRAGEAADTRTPTLDALPALVAGFRASGVRVRSTVRGTPSTAPEAERAAYRVVEEGLTNATTHAPGQPAEVTITWEPDALLVNVTNPVHQGTLPTNGPVDAVAADGRPTTGLADPRRGGEASSGAPGPGSSAASSVVAGGRPASWAADLLCGSDGPSDAGSPVDGGGPGFPGVPDGATVGERRRGRGVGLRGLAERVAAVGGLVDHRSGDGWFRLYAMIPLTPPAEPDGSDERPVRTAALALATALAVLLLLPAGMLVGVR